MHRIESAQQPMTVPGTTAEIMARLPRKLTISFWLWNYFAAAGKGEPFHDLERRMVELKERGFNTIRIEAGTGLCHAPDGRPRGVIDLRRPFGDYGTVIRQINGQFGRCDVLERLLELFELAKKHDVYIILTSWFYLHTFWFVDERIKAEMFGLSIQERLMAHARMNDHLLQILKARNLHTHIAFVELANESDLHFFYPYRKALPGGEAERHRAFRDLHEAALAYIQQRHPDVLFAGDTAFCTPPVDMLPRNMQVWNHHAYFMWRLYMLSFEEDLFKPDFDFRNPRRYQSLGRFLREPLISMEEIRRSCRNDPDVDDGWYRRAWLYANVDPAALGELDAWFAGLLARDEVDYINRADEALAGAVELRDRHFPGLPLVLGESVTWCAHMGFRWEERSDAYWRVIEYAARFAQRAGYWGFMPRTNSGPEDPSWTECAARYKAVNKLFLSDGAPDAGGRHSVRLERLLKIRDRRLSCFIGHDWMASALQPTTDVEAASYRGLRAALEWSAVPEQLGGFVQVNELRGPDGLVYLARQVQVAADAAGDWILHVGHDGGARVFVDGVAVAATAGTINPAPAFRTRARVTLAAGPHEIVVAFDRAGGNGWGIFVSFERLTGEPHPFPS